MSLAAVACPPHHWLVEEQPSGLQHWQCYRCGAERDQEPAALPERQSAAWAALVPRTPQARAE
jgi:hypothetical protein